MFAGSIWGQVKVQALSLMATIVWCALITYLILFFIDHVIDIRVPPEVEKIGLDETLHGEVMFHGESSQ